MEAHSLMKKHITQTEFVIFECFEIKITFFDVAAVALGQDVLAHGLDSLAGDDLAADGRLDMGTSKSWRGYYL